MSVDRKLNVGTVRVHQRLDRSGLLNVCLEGCGISNLPDLRVKLVSGPITFGTSLGVKMTGEVVAIGDQLLDAMRGLFVVDDIGRWSDKHFLSLLGTSIRYTKPECLSTFY